MTASNKPADPKRAERLKAALRDNLKRRKAQAKGRSRATGETSPSAPRESEDSGAAKR